jgi:hypothetical protein
VAVAVRSPARQLHDGGRLHHAVEEALQSPCPCRPGGLVAELDCCVAAALNANGFATQCVALDTQLFIAFK